MRIAKAANWLYNARAVIVRDAGEPSQGQDLLRVSPPGHGRTH